MTEPVELGPQTTRSAFRTATWLLGAILLAAVVVVVCRQYIFVERLQTRTLENLGGPFPPDGDFTVVMGPRSASMGIVKNLEDAIVGKSFVAFIRAFVLPDGDRELHFHFAPDTKPEVAAVKEAMPKSEH